MPRAISMSKTCSPTMPRSCARPIRTRRPSGCSGWPQAPRTTSSWSSRTGCRPTRASLPSSARQEVGDCADLAQEAVEHLLGVGVDAPLGVLAILLEGVEAPLELGDALVDALL